MPPGIDFGTKVGFGDFNGDGYGDLRASAPGQGPESDLSSSGVTFEWPGSAHGIRERRVSWWHQDTPHIKGEARTYEYLGTGLA